MKNIFCLFLLLALLFPNRNSWGEQIADSSEYIYDKANVLSVEEKSMLQQKLEIYKQEYDIEFVLFLSKGEIKKEADNFAATIAKSRKTKANLIVLTADVSQHTYGFYRNNTLKDKLPEWVIEKIEVQNLKRNFRKKDYFKGLTESTHILTSVIVGDMDINELKKDPSNLWVFLLIGGTIFFLILLPIIQFVRMRNSHLATKPLDFVSGVLLANHFGTRGKNVFDDFANSKGQFSILNELKEPARASGVTGSW